MHLPRENTLTCKNYLNVQIFEKIVDRRILLVILPSDVKLHPVYEDKHNTSTCIWQ